MIVRGGALKTNDARSRYIEPVRRAKPVAGQTARRVQVISGTPLLRVIGALAPSSERTTLDCGPHPAKGPIGLAWDVDSGDYYVPSVKRCQVFFHGPGTGPRFSAGWLRAPATNRVKPLGAMSCRSWRFAFRTNPASYFRRSNGAPKNLRFKRELRRFERNPLRENGCTAGSEAQPGEPEASSPFPLQSTPRLHSPRRRTSPESLSTFGDATRVNRIKILAFKAHGAGVSGNLKSGKAGLLPRNPTKSTRILEKCLVPD